MAIDTSFSNLARREIDDLHLFFQAWYSGGDNTFDLDRVTTVLAPEFELLAPNDEWITREQLLDELYEGRGRYPTLMITIEHLGYRPYGTDAASLEYTEQHVENGQVDKRLCCASLRRARSGSSGIEWVAIYERAGA